MGTPAYKQISASGDAFAQGT